MSIQFSGRSVNFSQIAGNPNAVLAAVAIMNGDPVNVAMENGMRLPIAAHQALKSASVGDLAPSNVVDSNNLRAVAGVSQSIENGTLSI